MKKIYVILLILLFLTSSDLLAVCNISSIDLNTSESGSWNSSCESNNNPGAGVYYAQYFTFTLVNDGAVTIDLTSSEDTYLILLNGSAQSGTVIAQDDDGGTGTNSRITRTLSKNTLYTIEVTTFAPQTTGNFLVSLSGLISGNCIDSINLNSSKSDSWESDCASENNAGAYAKYFTFTLPSSREVTINLTSSQDTLLFLLSGSGQTGSVIEQDDDDGSGTNSRIIRTLSAGTYTIEATTFEVATTGSFVVSLSDSTSGDCIDSIGLNISKSASWEPGCVSENNEGAYAKYFTFTLPSSREVTIDLTSSKDTLLFLLSGSGQTGSVIERDDDDGNGTNSRIIRTLPAGTYTIEAATFEAATTGNFVVSLLVSTPPCTDCVFLITAGVNDAWYNPATNGQGFTIIVFPDLKLIWVAWFTFDTERPAGDVTALLGEPGHRWLTAEGTYEGDTAELTIFVTKGGVFDAAQPATSTDLDGDGTMTIEFSDCTEGLVTYEITSLGISGEIPIQRLAPDNVPLCESLVEDAQKQ